MQTEVTAATQPVVIRTATRAMTASTPKHQWVMRRMWAGSLRRSLDVRVRRMPSTSSQKPTGKCRSPPAGPELDQALIGLKIEALVPIAIRNDQIVDDGRTSGLVDDRLKGNLPLGLAVDGYGEPIVRSGGKFTFHSLDEAFQLILADRSTGALAWHLTRH